MIFWNSGLRQAYPTRLFRHIAQTSHLARTLAHKLKKMHEKLANFASHSYFLKSCCEYGVIPKGIKVRYAACNSREERILEETEQQLLVSRKRFATARCFQLRAGIAQTEQRLHPLLDPETLARLLGACHDTYTHHFSEAQHTKAKKLSALISAKTWVFNSHPRLRQPAPPSRPRPPALPDRFLNISSRPLTAPESTALSLGSKFGLTPKVTPLADMCARVEFAAQSLVKRDKPVEAEEFRVKAIRTLSRIPLKPKPNLTRLQLQGINSLRRDRDRVILRADKAETLVVMDKADYEEKLKVMMENGEYEKLNANPYPRAANRFRDFLKSIYFPTDYQVPEDVATQLASQELDPGGGGEDEVERPRGRLAQMKLAYPRRYFEYKRVLKTHGVPSAVHCLPKTHKLPGPPKSEEERKAFVASLGLRIIAPSYGSVDKPLCALLTTVLNALPRPPHSLRSLETGIEAIQRHRPTPHSILCSFDIQSMYPSISIERSCQVVKRQLEQFNDLPDFTVLDASELTNLLHFCLTNTFIQPFDGTWYKQKDGLPMGKSISSAVAERFMIHLEERVMTESPEKPSLYLRWVDDTLACWDHGVDSLLNNFLPFLNSLDPSIVWTVELEKQKSINFLDCTIQRKEGWLHTSVYRKDCNIRHFVHANSNHPWSQKKSAIEHAYRRAFKYSSTPQLLREEEERVLDMFQGNGYTAHSILEVRQRVREKLRTEGQGVEPVEEPKEMPHDKPIKIGLPFIGPESKSLFRLGLRSGVYFALSNPVTMRRSFPSPKVKQTAAELGGAVYEITCGCPDGSLKRYIGQTGGPLTTRAKQHHDQWKAGRGSFAGHPKAAEGEDPEIGHDVRFDQARVVASEELYPVRIILEAFQIMKLTANGEAVIDNPNLAERDGPRINKSDGVRLSPLWLPLAPSI